MREIKFRAWDKRRNRIWQDVHLYQEDDRFILMQYTGLKDKNGVEIYEGDVVKDSQGVGQVGFSPPGFVVEVGEPERYWLGGGLEYPPNSKLPDTSYIGNIYENPEILNPHTKGGEMKPLENPCEGCKRNKDINNARCASVRFILPDDFVCAEFITRTQYQSALAERKTVIEWLEEHGGEVQGMGEYHILLSMGDWLQLKNSIGGK